MNVFGSLTPAEQARQPANPEGSLGIEIAEWLNGNNAQGNAKALEALKLEPGCRVLEIGFGNGRAAASIAAQGDAIHYAGVDISPTMLGEAERFNESLIASGRASFHLATADSMPFPDVTFDRVFSIGVIHFWSNPITSLVEVRRVSRPDSLVLMGCLSPQSSASEIGLLLLRVGRVSSPDTEADVWRLEDATGGTLRHIAEVPGCPR